jgi:hypothetical protein
MTAALQAAPDQLLAIVSRKVSVTALAEWQIEHFKRLLPSDITSHGPLNGPNTLLISAPDFVTLSINDVYDRVDALLEDVIAILNVYAPSTAWDFKVGQISDKLATGQTRATRRTTIAVRDRNPLTLLSEPVGKESRLRRLQRLSREDKQVAHALELLQRPDLSWSDVYNVLEFFQKTLRSIVAESQEFEDSRRTANHFRHLGHKGKYLLPKNPPSLDQARRYSARLLENWLEDLIAKAG